MQDSLVKPMSWNPRAERRAEKERAATGGALSTNGGRTELMYLFPILPKLNYEFNRKNRGARDLPDINN